MRGTLRAGIAVATTGLALGLVPSIAGAASTCRPTLAPAEEAVLAGLINAQRRAEGVPRVVTQGRLLKAGRKKSITMARGGAFAHALRRRSPTGGAAAQNIAMAPTADLAFAAMLASPAHRANMLAKQYRLTGIGAARACDGQVYFTINLMSRKRR